MYCVLCAVCHATANAVCLDAFSMYFLCRIDQSERCDLSLAHPEIVVAMQQRLVELQKTAVPCRFPNGDAEASKAWKANGGQRGPWQADPGI